MTINNQCLEANRLIDRGNRLEDMGDLATALGCYEQAVNFAPELPRCHLNLANVYARLGRVAEVVPTIERAIGLDPSFPPSHFNLGQHYAAIGQFEKATRSLRAALALDPLFADAAIALANALEALHKDADAEVTLRDTLQLDPANSHAATNLALLLIKRGAIDDAEAFLHQAVLAEPATEGALMALGTTHHLRGDAAIAERCYRAAIAAYPDSIAAHSALLFSLNTRDDMDTQSIFEEHVRFGERFPPAPPYAATPSAPPARRLRIGYVSADFRQHAVALFVLPVLAHHDRSQFEIFCYSNTAEHDPVTNQIATTVEHWREIVALDDPAAAALIRTDRIDVLLDLSGHTGGSRLGMFALRAAPVQMTWLGYLNTTGLRTMDFRICDGGSDPVGRSEHLHTERLLRMPNSQWCYQPAERIDVSFDSTPAADRPTVFGSFNQSWKISPPCLALWAQIMTRVAQSELRIVGVPTGRARSQLLSRLEDCGIANDRVDFLPRMNVVDYFSAIGAVDIALDTFPYNGGTTTLDALWMGVPVVALEGDRSISRSGSSIVSALGEPRLLARTRDEYLNTNVELASSPEWRLELRVGLRRRMLASPLMDANRFARDLEALYRQAIRGR